MKTLRWIAARLLFVLALVFSGFIWVSVGQARTDSVNAQQVLGFVVISVVCFAGFLACWFTPERRGS